MSTNRDELLKVAALVRPALSNQAYIPALTHICFDGGKATTYNDVASISVKCNVGLGLCVPGELLIKALGSFNAETVLLQEDAKTGNLVVSSGRSKMKVPTLPMADFPLQMPTGKPEVIELSDEVLAGVRRCLFSVGTDPTHPAQMGVTMDTEDGRCVLYSTDNFTISRCLTNTKLKLPGDSPVILPTFFCDQLLALAKAFPKEDIDLLVYAGALVAKFGNVATLMTKTLVDTVPMDFPAVISKHLDMSKVSKSLFSIPVTLDACFNRALLVLSSEADKATKVSSSPHGLELFSKSQLGDALDEVELPEGGPDCRKLEFHVDPSLVVRAIKVCGSMAVYPRVLVLASDDAKFVHLVAHCAA